MTRASLRALLVDPLRSSLLVMVILGVAGVLVVVLTWRGVAAQRSVAEQLPHLVSGGIGSLAMVAVAVSVFAIQTRRLTEARRRAELDRVLRAVTELFEAARDPDGEAG